MCYLPRMINYRPNFRAVTTAVLFKIRQVCPLLNLVPMTLAVIEVTHYCASETCKNKHVPTSLECRRTKP